MFISLNINDFSTLNGGSIFNSYSLPNEITAAENMPENLDGWTIMHSLVYNNSLLALSSKGRLVY